MVVVNLQCNTVVIPSTFYALRTTFSSSRDTGEVSSSHCGALGFIVSMISLQSFHLKHLLSMSLKYILSRIGLLINNSTRFKSSMHVGFVSTSTHEDLRCRNKFWEFVVCRNCKMYVNIYSAKA
jgi:hypothetical protein